MSQEIRQETQLHTAGIIVSARQVKADIRPIIDRAVISPGYALRARKAATTLFLVKIQKISQ